MDDRRHLCHPSTPNRLKLILEEKFSNPKNFISSDFSMPYSMNRGGGFLLFFSSLCYSLQKDDYFKGYSPGILF